MRCTLLKSRRLSDASEKKCVIFIRFSSGFAAVALFWVPSITSAQPTEFLSSLPVQRIEARELYTLGIRPARGPARRTPETQLDLYAEGLAVGSSFRRIGNEIWEFAWFPSEADRGEHVVRILVADRSAPSEILEVEEIRIVVGEMPIEPLASAALSEDSIVIQAAVKEPELVENVVTRPTNNVRVEPSPTWELAPVASHVVTPHQWVRFPVELISDAQDIDNFVLLQIDRLPNGATFHEIASGGRQFQWRPGTADSGEHRFRFTAVDKNDANRRENVTMRIIVQE